MVVHHTVVSAGSFASPSASVTSPLASRTRPYAEVVTDSPLVFATHTNSPRRKASTPCGARSHSTESPAPRSGWVRRAASAARYSSSVEPGVPVCASMLSSPQPSGCGSQLPALPKPYDDPSRVHGIGTRHPSRKPSW